jgi:hypothetical protein
MQEGYHTQYATIKNNKYHIIFFTSKTMKANPDAAA